MQQTQTTKNDELNIISYFSEMDLPEDEIQRRIDFAKRLEVILRSAFAETMTREEIIEYIATHYRATIEEDYDWIDEYFEEYIWVTAESVTDTTLNGREMTDERITSIAVNDTNVIANHGYDERMKKQGYTRKRWYTMNDNRVRHTHILADGQEVGIDETFKVGTCEMRYPCDTSLGATASEIINCRCVAKYF
jgi:uncharacterized protein with gpF-like domain